MVSMTTIIGVIVETILYVNDVDNFSIFYIFPLYGVLVWVFTMVIFYIFAVIDNWFKK
jgi:hypothetical protein